jgi:hypothetical protein
MQGQAAVLLPNFCAGGKKSSIALLRRDRSCLTVVASYKLHRESKKIFQNHWLSNSGAKCAYAKDVSLRSSYRVRANACYRAVCLSHGLEQQFHVECEVPNSISVVNIADRTSIQTALKVFIRDKAFDLLQ